MGFLNFKRREKLKDKQEHLKMMWGTDEVTKYFLDAWWIKKNRLKRAWKYEKEIMGFYALKNHKKCKNLNKIPSKNALKKLFIAVYKLYHNIYFIILFI